MIIGNGVPMPGAEPPAGCSIVRYPSKNLPPRPEELGALLSLLEGFFGTVRFDPFREHEPDCIVLASSRHEQPFGIDELDGFIQGFVIWVHRHLWAPTSRLSDGTDRPCILASGWLVHIAPWLDTLGYRFTGFSFPCPSLKFLNDGLHNLLIIQVVSNRMPETVKSFFRI